MARPTKYGKNILQTITEELLQHGDRERAWTIAGIGESAFYDYKKRFAEFSEAIEAAEKEYRLRKLGSAKTAAVDAFMGYLKGTHKKTTTKRKIVYLAGREMSNEVIVTEETCAPAPWAVQWVLSGLLSNEIQLPSKMTDLEAMQQLLQNGIALPEQAEIVQDAIATMEERLRQLPVQLKSAEVKEDGDIDL